MPRPNTSGIPPFGVGGSPLLWERGNPPVSKLCLNHRLVDYISTWDRQDTPPTITIRACNMVSNVYWWSVARVPGAPNQGHILVLFAHSKHVFFTWWHSYLSWCAEIMTMSLSSFEEPSILTICRNNLQAVIQHGEITNNGILFPWVGEFLNRDNTLEIVRGIFRSDLSYFTLSVPLLFIKCWPVISDSWAILGFVYRSRWI